MAWYPGMAFFLAIVAFNVWGEGLRRFLMEGRVNLSRLFNKYTAVAAGAVALSVLVVLRSTSPLGVYQAQAKQFDAGRAVEDIRVLASPEFQGRESGRPGLGLAAEYIAEQMREIELSPGGENNAYIQSVERSAAHFGETPRLEIMDEQGNLVEPLIYREDFAAYTGPLRMFCESEGAIIGLTTGDIPGADGEEGVVSARARSLTNIGEVTLGQDLYGLRNYDIGDKIILVREAELGRININVPAGTLAISDDPSRFQRRYLTGNAMGPPRPLLMFITPEVADRLLATAGSSLDELDSLTASLRPGEVALTDPGVAVYLEMVREDSLNVHLTVVGYIAGTGAAMEVQPEAAESDQLRPENPLSNQVVIVSAYYDGLGIGLDGTLYPGANDNSSGVATMLEIARVLKEAPHPPKRTVLFVAWPDGERYEGLSVSNVMNINAYFRSLTVETVIELSGVGAGTGEAIVLGEGSSYRLVQLFQDAADRLGTSVTTRGRGPHYGLYTELGYGGRSALTAYVSWDGSDRTAHTPEDTFEAIDPQKLEQVGEATLLVLTVLSREVKY